MLSLDLILESEQLRSLVNFEIRDGYGVLKDSIRYREIIKLPADIYFITAVLPNGKQ